jgi:hypothetical protein
LWVTGTRLRFNSDTTGVACAHLQTDKEAVSNSNRFQNACYPRDG